MQYVSKAVWSILYVPVAFFPSLKQSFIAYRSSKVSSRPDCIFEVHQLWQSGFSKVYSKSCCSCSFEPEIIKKISQLSHKMYSNNIVNFQESMTILNACIKKVWKLIEFITYMLILNFSVTGRMWHKVNFKQSLTGLNSEFLLLVDRLPYRGLRNQFVLQFFHSSMQNSWMHKGINAMWNANSFVQDLNSGSRFHFLRQ